MSHTAQFDIPVGTRALILSKYYYGVLSKSLEHLELERYYSILFFLHSNDGCCQQQICNHLAIDKTAMVKVIAHLEKAGMIERRVNPGDKREYFITLTKKGLKETEEIVASFREIDTLIFDGIKQKEKEIFLKVLDQLTTSLIALPGNDLFFNYAKTARKPGQSRSTTNAKKNIK